MMGRWLGVLLAETGSTTDPATLHYDYIDVETTANVIQLAKQSFWWAEQHLLSLFRFVVSLFMSSYITLCFYLFSFTSKRAISPNPYLDSQVNGYACPSGMALHYDDVPINGMVSTPGHFYCGVL